MHFLPKNANFIKHYHLFCDLVGLLGVDFMLYFGAYIPTDFIAMLYG